MFAPVVQASQSTQRPLPRFDQSSSQEPKDTEANRDAKDGKDHKEEERPHEPRAYDKVIPKDALTQHGLVTLHKVKDNWYFEIPASMLAKPFLFVARIETGPSNVDRGQFLQSVVRWELGDKKVYLREQHYDTVSSDPNAPVEIAVRRSSINPIMMAFPVETTAPDGSVVIEVSRLLNGDIPGFSVQTLARAGARDATRSFIETVHDFPTNIEVQSVTTFNGGSGNPAKGAASSSTLGLHYSLIALPEKPMLGRLADDRVGFFTRDAVDYGRKDGGVEKRDFITRWRLEKKDPNAAVSDVVQPIVFYIDPATPTQWVPYIRRAVEAWQPAFEAAGYRNAIISKLAPTLKEDPDWNVEDVRYSVIRWLPSTTTNAMGPHIDDPRSGEILNAPVVVYQNVLQLVTRWYFTQAAPLDARARTLPFPVDLTGSLLQTVVEHEVGHSLGLMHNFKASSLYSIAQIRDPKWVKTMGFSPSIMDYARFNYVAQPEDGMSSEDLLPRIGPYDKFAIHWGYAPIPSAMTPEVEQSTLNLWAREQDTKPYLRFAPDDSVRGIDPGEEVEAIGDSDSITATTLGLKNLHRVETMLLPASSAEPGQPYDNLNMLFNALGRQWATELDHVERIVAGADSVNKHEGQPGPRYTPVSRERQRAAVRFLLDNAFQRPDFLLDPHLSLVMRPDGILDRVSGVEAGILGDLLASTRVQRLREWQTVGIEDAYAPDEFFNDVRRGVWKEIYTPGVTRIDPIRQNLQHAYTEAVIRQINSNIGLLYRAEALTLSRQLKLAIPRMKDPDSRASLEDSLFRITKSIDPMAGLVQLAPITPPKPEPPAPDAEDSSDWRSSRRTDVW